MLSPMPLEDALVDTVLCSAPVASLSAALCYGVVQTLRAARRSKSEAMRSKSEGMRSSTATLREGSDASSVALLELGGVADKS